MNLLQETIISDHFGRACSKFCVSLMQNDVDGAVESFRGIATGFFEMIQHMTRLQQQQQQPVAAAKEKRKALNEPLKPEVAAKFPELVKGKAECLSNLLKQHDHPDLMFLYRECGYDGIFQAPSYYKHLTAKRNDDDPRLKFVQGWYDRLTPYVKDPKHVCAFIRNVILRNCFDITDIDEETLNDTQKVIAVLETHNFNEPLQVPDNIVKEVSKGLKLRSLPKPDRKRKREPQQEAKSKNNKKKAACTNDTVTTTVYE